MKKNTVNIKILLDNDDKDGIINNMNKTIAQIDVEIEACERAIRSSFSSMEVEKLTAVVQAFIKKRFAAYTSHLKKPEEIENE